MYVEDLKRGTNKDIGPKDIFEMGSSYIRKGKNGVKPVFENSLNRSEASMKPIIISLLAVFTIVVGGFSPVMDAAAEDQSCVFKADAKKFHLTVWDEGIGRVKSLKAGLSPATVKKFKAAPVLLFSAIN